MYENTLMSSNEVPEWLRLKHPELSLIEEALAAHREGRPSVARCPLCNEPLETIDVKGINSYVIACRNGHTLLNAN